MCAVQTRPGSRWRSWSLTGLAALLVGLALTTPDQVQELTPARFLRLPLEPLLLLALALALPPRFGRARALLAILAGAVLGLVAVHKLLAMGFWEALNRPFDAVIDWTYAGSLVDLVHDSLGQGPGTVVLVLAALTAVALLVLLPLASLRLTRLAGRHRSQTLRGTAVLVSLWLLLAALDVRAGGGAVAAWDTSAYAYHQVTRIPSELEDRRQFVAAAGRDPLRQTARQPMFDGLRGKDVLVVFVESYGRVALEGSPFSTGVNAVLASGTQRLDRAGFLSRSAYLTSPTFGALSWLAHATLQSGLWVDSQQRYDVAVTSSRLTLSRMFRRAGWRTVAAVPANDRDWPQAAFYDFEHVYDSRNIGYRGPRFGYPTMPDQYTLEAFHRMELAAADRRPVMAEIDLISSHAPWSRTPRLVDQSAVGDGSVYQGMPEQLPSERDIWTSASRVRAAYGESIEYSLRALLTFLTTYGDDDLVVVLLGDHQPATIVSGPDAGHDVPIALVSRDQDVIDRVAPWGWSQGLRPPAHAPVWRMDAFRDRFVAAFGKRGDTGLGPAQAP